MSLFITELFNNCEQYQEKRIEKGYLTQEMKKGKRCEEAEDHKDDCVCVYIYTHTHTHTARNEEFNSEAEEFRNYQSNFTND